MTGVRYRVLVRAVLLTDGVYTNTGWGESRLRFRTRRAAERWVMATTWPLRVLMRLFDRGSVLECRVEEVADDV